MPTYLVESYGADRRETFADARERAHLAAQLGDGVEYLRTTFVPGEETLLHVFEASSAESLRRAAQLAALPFERIAEAVEAPAAPARGEFA